MTSSLHDPSVDALLATLPETARRIAEAGIQGVSDLMQAEEYFDVVESGLLIAGSTYVELCQQAQQYIRHRWDLSQPWVRPAGAVHDMLLNVLRELDSLPPAHWASQHESLAVH